MIQFCSLHGRIWSGSFTQNSRDIFGRTLLAMTSAFIVCRSEEQLLPRSTQICSKIFSVVVIDIAMYSIYTVTTNIRRTDKHSFPNQLFHYSIPTLIQLQDKIKDVSPWWCKYDWTMYMLSLILIVLQRSHMNSRSVVFCATKFFFRFADFEFGRHSWMLCLPVPNAKIAYQRGCDGKCQEDLWHCERRQDGIARNGELQFVEKILALAVNSCCSISADLITHNTWIFLHLRLHHRIWLFFQSIRQW